jgi:hypothetical protein
LKIAGFRASDRFPPAPAKRIFALASASIVGESGRPRDWTAAPLRELHVASGVLHKRFMDAGVAGIMQNLIDAPPGHNIAAEKQPDGMVRICCR